METATLFALKLFPLTLYFVSTLNYRGSGANKQESNEQYTPPQRPIKILITMHTKRPTISATLKTELFLYIF